MTLRKWINHRLVFVFTGITVIIGGMIYLFLEDNSAREAEHTQYVINQVRFRVSNVMTYLETNDFGNYSEEDLTKLSGESGVRLAVADTGGNIIYNTDNTGTKIDIRNAVHYDLYTARLDKGMIKIAFPIVDPSNIQIGNAIFTMPSSYILDNSRRKGQLPVLMALIVILVIIFGIFCLFRKRIFNRMLLPIQKLKENSEAILKGDYTRKAEYTAGDEIGEVYDVFDQMRVEVMALSVNRDNRDRAQKELITNISHDLRTPITSIKAYVEAIKAGVCKDEDTLSEYMDIIQANIDKMARLTEDLLLHALNELGQISVKPREQYSRNMLENIIKPLAYQVRSEGFDFIEPEIIPDVLIRADEHRIEQVISNLVSNACKHTGQGGTIKIKPEVVEHYLKITISDTGEGISPQDMPFIFHRYFQGQNSIGGLNSAKEGAGLGLSICKHIIEAHNGQISFRSKKGEGTDFYFTIPLL